MAAQMLCAHGVVVVDKAFYTYALTCRQGSRSRGSLNPEGTQGSDPTWEDDGMDEASSAQER
jgi:hypothetical protein